MAPECARAHAPTTTSYTGAIYKHSTRVYSRVLRIASGVAPRQKVETACVRMRSEGDPARRPLEASESGEKAA